MITQGLRAETTDYYVRRRPQILDGFKEQCGRWKDIICRRWDTVLADSVLRAAHEHLDSLILLLPYIGGDDNHLTESLIGSAQCLAFFRAMEQLGRSAEETGKVLYDAVTVQIGGTAPSISSGQVLSRVDMMSRRRERAQRSQEREYAWDWVYEFIEGDGETFDYGYDFVDCATAKFYRALGADKFLPFYCFLDFPKCESVGLGLTRTTTLAEGFERCDFRFREEGRASQSWPPLFLSGRDLG